MAFEKMRTIVITAIPKPRSRERFSKIAETIPTPGCHAAKQRRPGGGKIGQMKRRVCQGSFKPEYKGQMELYLRWLASTKQNRASRVRWE